MAAPKLYYFDGRGKGAIVRLTLAACGIKFTEELLTEREQIEKWRSDGLLLFSQVPMLEIDGLRLVQTGAIVRYIADKEGLLGSSHEETARINELFEGSRDFMSAFYPAVFVDIKEVLEKASAKSLPRYLPIFDKVLKKNGTGFLVGDSVTLADIGLLEPVLMTIDYYGLEALKDYPSLQEFHKKVTSLPNMAEFLAGPQRRKPNDDVYVSTVKKVIF
ncbi:glutathione S-transferase A4-like [Haliotis rubra]|uniref:glutathione S-transferase A4-like n=1 Tax=Haliotis rubra TaxID=36100 RepID=UPI001EE54364|nr:glutathione S-transferase A4-like [Haliotis rubra]